MRATPKDHLAPNGTARPFPPPLDRKRAMLTEMREQFRAKGYQAELNIEALEVQSLAGDEENISSQRLDLENTRDNCYASARRMDEMLSKLPKPKEKQA